MEKLSIEAGTPISCFVEILNETSALVQFYAPNGKPENFCGHGFVSVVRHLKEIGQENVQTLITANNVTINAKFLPSGASSLEIPVNNFDITSFESEEIYNLFSLTEKVEGMFKAGKLGDVLVEVKDSTILHNLKFPIPEVKKFLKANNLRIVSFFCKDSKFNNINAEIRVFYVNLDTLEDVVCGSINISVARILFAKYGISNYKAVQPYNYEQDGKVGGYQEVEYSQEKELLTLNGFTEKREEKFIFEPLNIKFNEAFEPLIQNYDYTLLRTIFTNYEIMKTSTAFGGELARNDYDLHSLMNLLLEKEDEFKRDYGLQKVFNTDLNAYIGVAGLIRFQNNVSEYAIFLKPEFSGLGLGNLVLKELFKKADERNENVICSIYKENFPSIKIAEKNGMVFTGQMQKNYKNKIIDINLYARSKNKDFKLNLEDAVLTKKIA